MFASAMEMAVPAAPNSPQTLTLVKGALAPARFPFPPLTGVGTTARSGGWVARFRGFCA